MLHILEPFDYQFGVYPGQISGQVGIVGRGKIDKPLAGVQFFREVKNCMEQIRKPVVFKDLGIFKEGQHQALMLQEEFV
jgi:hypothetical protein